MEEKEKNHLLSIRQHSSACADPAQFESHLQTLLQKKWNKDKDGLVCGSVMKEGKRHLLSYDGETFSIIDVSKVPDKDLVNASSQEKTFDRVQERLVIFRNKLSAGNFGGNIFQAFDPDQYKLNSVQQGEQVVVPAEPGTMVACIFGPKFPTYYDLNIYDHSHGGIVNFSHKRKENNIFEHSGDVSGECTPSQTIQFVKLKTTENIAENGQRIALFITGYSATPLVKFHSDSPVNLLFDHKKKIIHIIEFPLDKASVGSATLGIPGVGEFKNGYLYFDVFSKPDTGGGSAPEYKPDTMDKLKSAVNRFSACRETALVEPMDVDPISKAVPSKLFEKQETKVEHGVSPHILEVNIGKVKGIQIQSSHQINSVGGISCYLHGKLDKRVHTVVPSDLGSIILPGLLGPIEGPFICLAAHPIEGNGVSPHNLEYFKNCFPIVIVSTAMTDAARQTTGNNRINGLFIIEPEGLVDTPEKLAMVNKNAVTALAGPLSLVLVKHGETFLYLEGIPLQGLMKKVPEFGDTVHLEMEPLIKWAHKNCIDEPIVDITKCKPQIGDKSFTLPEIISLMKTLSIDEILAMKQTILCLYYQLTRIYDDDELQNFAKELFDVLDKILTTPDKNNAELKQIKEDFEKGNTKIQISSKYMKSKEEYAMKRKQLKFLMDKVSSLLSEKNASSKAMSHKQLKRFNAIKSNVDRLKTMSREDFEGSVEDSCSEMGVLVCAGEPAELKDFLDTIGKNTMRERIVSNTTNRMDEIFQQTLTIDIDKHLFQLSLRQQMLDALTATCILQVTYGSGPLRSLDNSVTLSIPESNEGRRGAVLIPLLDMFVQMRDPYTGNWINLCNEPDVAMFRLIMRRTFIQASLGKELPQQIDTSSKDLGWGMVNIYLSLMHQLSSHRKTPMSEENFDETLCQQIRCLFGLVLTQLAAGQDPISLIWTLWRENVRPELPMQSWHWPLYLEMAYLMQFTGWSQDVFRRNLKILLIRAMNSKIAYPMCRFLRDGKEKVKGKRNNTNYEKKLQDIFYPAKKNMTKITLMLLKTGQIPSKDFLSEYENIFTQYTNQKVKRKGIKTLLKEIALMIKFGNQYHEDSRQYMIKHCETTIQKYEPRLKICRLELKRTLEKSLAENKAPDQDQIQILTNEMEEVSKTIGDREKIVIFSVVFKKMQKVLQLLTDWSSGKIMTDEVQNVAKELTAKMYQGLEFDCWNIAGLGHNEGVAEGDFSHSDIEDVKTEGKDDDEKDILKQICSGNKEVATVVDKNKPALERVEMLAKMVKIEEASVLIKLAGLAGFGNTDEKVMENLCFTLQQLFQHWTVDPHVVEKLIADKISAD